MFRKRGCMTKIEKIKSGLEKIGNDGASYKRDMIFLLSLVDDLTEKLEAITLAAIIDCPRTEAWKNLVETCQETLKKGSV